MIKDEKQVNVSNLPSELEILNSLTLTPEANDFVKTYYLTGSLETTAKYLDKTVQELIIYFKDPSIQSLIRDLHLARNRHIFTNKMLTLGEIGSYLTNTLLDTSVSQTERLTPKEKLEAAKLLIEVNKTLDQNLQSSPVLDSFDSLTDKFEKLSVNTIKTLLITNNNNSNNLHKATVSPTEDHLNSSNLFKSTVNNEQITNIIDSTDSTDSTDFVNINSQNIIDPIDSDLSKKQIFIQTPFNDKNSKKTYTYNQKLSENTLVAEELLKASNINKRNLQQEKIEKVKELLRNKS